MIMALYGTTGGVIFSPKDEDGCIQENPIVITKDNGDSTILHQESVTICIPNDKVPEFIKALKKHLELL